jgi:hypothetical protein
MVLDGNVYTAADTDELAQIVEGLKYYASRINQLKNCILNAESSKNDQAEAKRSEFKVIRFQQGT